MIKTRKKLQLKSNIVRALSFGHLAVVAGGKTTPTNDTFRECPPPPEATDTI